MPEPFESDKHQRKNLRTPQWRVGRGFSIIGKAHFYFGYESK